MEPWTRFCIRAARTGAIGLIVLSTLINQSLAVPLTLTGELTAGSSYEIADLQAMSAFTYTVGTDKYKGASLWGLFGGNTTGTMSNITTSKNPLSDAAIISTNNTILSNYVMATGSDGKQSLLSVGEFDPLFGGKVAMPYLVAYERNDIPLTVPILVVPQDTSGTRNVENLVNLSVVSVRRPPKGPGGVTTEFKLTGVDNPDLHVNLAKLTASPPVTEPVSFSTGGAPPVTHNFTGADLWEFLYNAGLGGIDNILTSYMLATGSDGFEVLYSLAELNPAFGAPVDLIAYADSLPFANNGFARIAIPGENRGGRLVSNVASIQLVELDEPSILALFGLALLGMCLVRPKRDEGAQIQ